MNMIKSKSVLIEVDKEVNTASELISLTEEFTYWQHTHNREELQWCQREFETKRFTL